MSDFELEDERLTIARLAGTIALPNASGAQLAHIAFLAGRRSAMQSVRRLRSATVAAVAACALTLAYAPKSPPPTLWAPTNGGLATSTPGHVDQTAAAAAAAAGVPLPSMDATFARRRPGSPDAASIDRSLILRDAVLAHGLDGLPPHARDDGHERPAIHGPRGVYRAS